MKICSVNVGQPRQAEFRGVVVSTSIFKSAVEGRVMARTLNLDGDAQADLRVHGGRHKAAYVYPHEHYSYWRTQLEQDLTMGNFGENLTTQGVSEEEFCLGDHVEIGSALFAVTQPRTPCFKLQVRFQREDMTKRFFESRRFGFYLCVLREGEIGAGDAIKIVQRDENRVTAADAIRLYAGDIQDRELADRALRVPTLSTRWQEELRTRRAGW